MGILSHFVMIGWIPTVLLLFAVLSPLRAVIVAFLAGFLFLPMASYNLPFLPDYTKMSATCVGILLGSICFDSKRILSLSLRPIDLPMAAFCVIPLGSSLANGLGLWDGVSGVLTNFVTWGLPYLIGRAYFTDLPSLKELAIGIFIGGVIYIPFCVFEMRMSPQLHDMLYGFHSRPAQIRFDGWRPSVFLDGGLQLGMWMAVASMVGIWLWWSGELKKVGGIPAGYLVAAIFVTTVLCRASGALALMIMGLGAMWIMRSFGTRAALWGLLLFAPAYIGLRTTGLWHGEEITALAGMLDADRAQSFQFRMDNEDMLIERAMQQPILGWGGWGGSRVYDEWGKDISITDGFWVIELGGHGLIGVAALYTAFLIPLGLMLFRTSIRQSLSPKLSPALVLAVTVTLFSIDCLLNAMPNPVYVLVAGAVTSVLLAGQRNLSSSEDETAGHRATQSNSGIARRMLYPTIR